MDDALIKPIVPDEYDSNEIIELETQLDQVKEWTAVLKGRKDDGTDYEEEYDELYNEDMTFTLPTSHDLLYSQKCHGLVKTNDKLIESMEDLIAPPEGKNDCGVE